MAGEDHGVEVPVPESLLQRRQGPHRQLVVLRQGGDEAVAAVRPEPDGVPGEEIAVVHKIDHVAPGVAGDLQALDLDAVDVQDLAIVQEDLVVADGHLGELIEVIDDLPADLAREVAVLRLAEVEPGGTEEAGAVGLHGAHVVGILVGDEDVADAGGIDAQPAHLLRQAVIVVPGVDHDGGAALAVEEDVGHPLPDAGHVLIHPAGIQGLEDLLAPVHPAHFLLLKLCRLLAHLRSLFPRSPSRDWSRLVPANYQAVKTPLPRPYFLTSFAFSVIL